jgi:hypothetical protein
LYALGRLRIPIGGDLNMVTPMSIVCYPDEVKTILPEWAKDRPDLDSHYIAKQKRKHGRFTAIVVMQVNLYFIVPIFFQQKADAVRNLFANDITKWDGGLTYVKNSPYVCSIDHTIYSGVQKGAVSGRQPSFCFDITRLRMGQNGFAYYGFRSMRKWIAPNGKQIVRPVLPYDFNAGGLSQLVDRALYNE